MWKRMVARDGDTIDILHTDRGYTDVVVTTPGEAPGHSVMVFSMRNVSQRDAFYVRSPR